MEVCRVPRPLPPIILRSDNVTAFRTATVSCNRFPDAKCSSRISMNNQMFILGMGFVGQFFAADLKAKGWVVSGSCTRVAKKGNLEELGYSALVFDANEPDREILEIVKDYTHLLVSIPPVRGLGDPLLGHNGLVESTLKGGRLQWLAYLSSTSVYGDWGGSWVDEDCPPNPESELARTRLVAEEEWLQLGHNLGIVAQVFRLGGIYGPGRSAVDTVLKQESLSERQKTRLSKTFTSRVHVADICQALNASISKPRSGMIYNIVDDDPAPRAEVFGFARDLVEEKFAGHEKKHYTSLERSESPPVMEKISRGEKRVSNARMKKELGVKLFHPTYRSGLRSIIEHMNH